MSELSKTNQGQKPQAQQESPAPAPVKPRIPPREPAGESDWKVSCRHTPLLLGKQIVVKATSREDAWRKYLAAAAVANTEKAYQRIPNGHQRAQEWIAQHANQVPDDTEILGAEYSDARRAMMRAKGTVTVEQVGFPELASA